MGFQAAFVLSNFILIGEGKFFSHTKGNVSEQATEV